MFNLFIFNLFQCRKKRLQSLKRCQNEFSKREMKHLDFAINEPGYISSEETASSDDENGGQRRFKVMSLPWRSHYLTNLFRSLDTSGRQCVARDRRGGQFMERIYRAKRSERGPPGDAPMWAIRENETELI